MASGSSPSGALDCRRRGSSSAHGHRGGHRFADRSRWRLAEGLLSGERDAWIASVSKGAPVIKNIKNEGGKFHLLEIPYKKSLQDIYLPSSFSSEEYPNLVPQGGRIDGGDERGRRRARRL